VSRRVEHDGKRALQIRFPYDRDLVDLIKTLPGRRWNASERFWFVPENQAVDVVDALAGEDFAFDEATRRLYVALGGTRALDAAPVARDLPLFADVDFDEPVSDDLSVAALNRRVRDLLRGAFPAPVWLVGEISGFNKSAHRKHVGFEMIERDEQGTTVSKISAILFEHTRREIEQQLKHAGDPFRLEDEISVRLEVRIDVKVEWGKYQVVVERLDPDFTLGEAARRREEIVRRLTEAGLHEINPALDLPTLPLRVGLITSLGSDAYNDVLRSLRESGYAFDVTVHGARVQGNSTEPSVLNALDWFARRADEFDALLICRGGGSRTDLTWFDTERLGRAVALFPLPVIVGIGHEQDRSVLDAVARSCKTPTAAAGLLVERVAAAAERVETIGAGILAGAAERIDRSGRRSEECAARLARAVRHRLDLAGNRLDQIERQTRSSSRAALASARERLALFARRIPREGRRLLDRSLDALHRIETGLGPATRRGLERERERLEGRHRRLDLVHPRRVIERGYAILRREDDTVLVDAAAAASGETLVAELKHGRLRVSADKMVPEKG
jgi:exodeoxyribonuclease VII large subunit